MTIRIGVLNWWSAMGKGSDPYETILAELEIAKGALSRATKLLEKIRPEPSLLSAKIKIKPVMNGHAEQFTAFYAAFPRHVGKADAYRAYERALKRTTAEVIFAGAVRYAETTRGKEEQYIKHPATWLNGDGWLDEIGTASKSLTPVIDPALERMQRESEDTYKDFKL